MVSNYVYMYGIDKTYLRGLSGIEQNKKLVEDLCTKLWTQKLESQRVTEKRDTVIKLKTYLTNTKCSNKIENRMENE